MSVNWVELFAKTCPKTATDETVVPSLFSADLQLGAFGSIDASSVFEQRGLIDTMPAHDPPAAQGNSWYASGGTTVSRQGGVHLQGSAIDPDSGTKVTVGTEVTWGFSETTDMCVQFANIFHSSLDPAQVMDENLEQITLDAERYGYTTKGGTLKPGWVVITDVYQIIAGIVVGSDAKTKTFSITGAGNAVNDLVDGQAGGGFSYTSSTVTDDLWYVTFPGDPVSLNADGTGVDPSTVGSTDKLYTVGFQAVGMENGVITPYRRGSLLTPPVPV